MFFTEIYFRFHILQFYTPTIRQGGGSGPTARQGATDSDEAPLQLAAVQLSHCVWGLHAWGPRGSDPTAGEVTAADPVPTDSPPKIGACAKGGHKPCV